MNDAYENVDSVEASRGALLCIADLGDAVEETKEWSPNPFDLDNLAQWGWEL